MENKINKIVIWGHPLGSHTHSFIHGAFYKAFQYMGYDTYWFKDGDDVSNIDLSNSLFITEGQVDLSIPLIKDSYYILHNTDSSKYREAGCKCLFIQVLHKKTIDIPNSIIINKYTILEKGNGIDCLYFPWATDLLPNEIDPHSAKNNQTGDCIWIGTRGGGSTLYENWSMLDPFFNECENNNITLNWIDPWGRHVSFERNKEIVNESYLAPAIQGKWQVDVGYVPCRIFKNISYGHFGYTNSSFVNEIFDNRLVYSADTKELFHKAIEKKKDPNHLKELMELMIEVKEKHTYINRIEEILKCLPK